MYANGTEAHPRWGRVLRGRAEDPALEVSGLALQWFWIIERMAKRGRALQHRDEVAGAGARRRCGEAKRHEFPRRPIDQSGENPTGFGTKLGGVFSQFGGHCA